MSRAGFAVLTAAVIIIGAAAFLPRLAYNGRILPGVSVGAVHLGGSTVGEAAALIDQESRKLNEMRFRHGGRTYTVGANEIGLEIDAKGSAANAMASGRQHLLASPRVMLGITVPAVFRYNADALKTKLLRDTDSLNTPMKNAEVVGADGGFAIVPEQEGRVVDAEGNLRAAERALGRLQSDVDLYVRRQQPELVARNLGTAKAVAIQMSRQPMAVVAGERTFRPAPAVISGWVGFERQVETPGGPIFDRVDQIAKLDDAWGIGRQEQSIVRGERRSLRVVPNRDKVGEYVAVLADEVDRDPENARLAFTNGQLVITGQQRDGLVVERTKSVGLVTGALRDSRPQVVLPMVPKPADIRQETLPTLGITQLIGSSTTTFAGSPANRTYNIGVGARRFDGVLIKPGETFSFNENLGDVGPETGYRQELVIVERRTEPQYGGGLCQVSTTTFRAAMAAGLPIVDRTNHSYAVHYYAPIGMDATIYPPSPDLKFKNNTPGHILIQTRTAGQSVTFDFYGSPDGRSSATQVLSINASESAGGTASFRYTVTGGPEPIDRVFYSTYRPQSEFPRSNSLN